MCLNKNCSKMHQDFFRALTYDHHFRQKSAIYCYRLNSIVKTVLYVGTILYNYIQNT